MATRRANRRKSRKILRRTTKKKTMPNIITRKRPILGNMSLGQLAGYAAKGVSMMSGIINSELKRSGYLVSVFPTPSASLNNLSLNSQGTDAYHRTGNSVLAKYLTLNYSVVMDPGARCTITRVLVFVDTESTAGNTPVSAQVLEDPSTIHSPLNNDYTSRFTVLFDDYITTSITGMQCYQTKHYKPLDFHMKWTGPLITNWDKNSIWVLTQSSEPTNAPTVQMYARLSFYDN